MKDYSAYVGLDVHKDEISVAVAMPGRSKADYRGTIPNNQKAMMKLVNRMSSDGEEFLFATKEGHVVTRSIGRSGGADRIVR